MKSAIDYIEEAARENKTLLIGALRHQNVEDMNLAAQRKGMVKESILARADGYERAITAVKADDIASLVNDVGAGSSACLVACRLLKVSRDDMIDAIEKSWPG